MRFCGILLALLSSATLASAGEVIVYNQKWTAKYTGGSYPAASGKGYLLVDLENHKVTRIATGKNPVINWLEYTVETYDDAVIAEPGSSSAGGVYLAVHANERVGPSYPNTQVTLFFKGREKLLQIGPSQQKQTAKTVTGIRRYTRAASGVQQIEENAFTATFSSSLTMDTNGNSRTIEQEVELLTKSLDEAGYRRR